MKLSAFLLASGVMAVAMAGCGRQESHQAASAPSPPPVAEVTFRYQFIGGTQLTNASDATKLREIWILPQSRSLGRFALDRLARSPGIFQSSLSSNTVESGAGMLRPLLLDLVRQESGLVVRTSEPNRLDWTLMVQLPPERMAEWRRNLLALGALWNAGAPQSGTNQGCPTVEFNPTGGARRVRWVEAGAWGILGVGGASMPDLDRALAQVNQTQRALPLLTNAWLELDGDLRRLAGPLGLAPDEPWPKFQLQAVGQDENLRTTGRLSFPQVVTGNLDPWNVPTNLISEPMISFTAARGVRGILDRVDLLKRLRLGPMPNELYAWAQQVGEFTSYLAFPAEGLKDRLADVAEAAPTLLPEWARALGLARFSYVATNATVQWKDLLPVVVPVLHSTEALGREHGLISLFPPAYIKPPPEDLLNQLHRSNLVFYSWEITYPRLIQWRTMSQLVSVLTETPQLRTNQPALPWLMSVESRLGNAVTEVTLISPSEWEVSRKSQLGFTAMELVYLARWIESTAFPKPGVRLPVSPDAPASRPPRPTQSPPP